MPPKILNISRWRTVLLWLLAATTGSWLTPAPACADFDDIVDVIAETSVALVQDGDTLRLPYLASHPLDVADSALVRLVISQHGTLRNVDDYFLSMSDAADLAGDAADSCLILAPQFLIGPDLVEHELPADYLCWEYMGWRQGDLSLDSEEHPRPWQISSFAVIDTLLVRLAATLPALRSVIVAGHSAGGQLANRYASGSPIPDLLATQYGIHCRFVVANPSTYLYLNDERREEDTFYEFGVPHPDTIAACPEYNDYKYGLQNPNEYFTVDPDTLRHRYRRREVVILLGGQDNSPGDFYLDRSCPAMFQGNHRLERGIVFYRYLEHYFGEEISELHRLAIVPWAGHSHYQMFQSGCGVYFLFDHGDCVEAPAEDGWERVGDPAISTPGSHAVAWGDYDNDGRPDLYICGADESNRLLRNTEFGFLNVTPGILNDASFGLSCAWGDYDGDGWRDLTIANLGGIGRLVRNDGTDFVDVTPEPLAHIDYHTDTGWADYDGDGDLDLYVGKSEFLPNLLLRNDGGDFVNVAEGPEAGEEFTRGIAWADFDNDGDPDLFVANQAGPCRLLRNEGGSFVDVTPEALTAEGDYSSSAWGDYDNDGWLDLYVGLRGWQNRLYRNDHGELVDVSAAPHNYFGHTRSVLWSDFDNDGWLDLYLINFRTGNRLLRNQGDGGFVDATDLVVGDTNQGYSGATADFDGDGWLDIYVGNFDAENRLLRNRGHGGVETGGHWLAVDLADDGGNSHGVGARITVVTGLLRQMREVGSGDGYMGQSSLTAHFGLGAAVIADSVIVDWPGGERQILSGLIGDRRLVIDRQVETDAHEPPPQPLAASIRAYPNPFNPATTIVYALPAAAQARLVVYGLDGREIATLVDGPRAGGEHFVRWDGTDGEGRPLSSGTYVIRLTADGVAQASKVSLLR